MAEYIIDTNVWVVASGGHEGAFGDCVMACIELLSGLREQGAALVMDDLNQVIGNGSPCSLPIPFTRRFTTQSTEIGKKPDRIWRPTV